MKKTKISSTSFISPVQQEVDLIVNKLAEEINSFLRRLALGGFNQPRKVDVYSYMLLDKAIELSQQSLQQISRRNYNAAINLSEIALKYLDHQESINHSTLFDLYDNLVRSYEEVGDKEKSEKIKNDSINLRFF